MKKSEVTREELDILTAQVQQNAIVVKQAYDLARQIHLYLKSTDFQYAGMVDRLNEEQK